MRFPVLANAHQEVFKLSFKDADFLVTNLLCQRLPISSDRLSKGLYSKADIAMNAAGIGQRSPGMVQEMTAAH